MMRRLEPHSCTSSPIFTDLLYSTSIGPFPNVITKKTMAPLRSHFGFTFLVIPFYLESEENFLQSKQIQMLSYILSL